MSDDYMDGAVELPRRHDLAPRSWLLRDGSIVGEAVNREAIELLKNDPDEYFRRTRTPRPGRLRGWLIARRLGLRCLVCNRRAGYGGRCPNPDHNG